MTEKYRKIVTVVCLVLSAALVFAADDALVSRYLNAANDQYSAGNHAKAFSYINTVLGSFKEEALPDNIEVISETIYYAYLVQIKDAKDRDGFIAVKEKLIEYPFLSSDRIARTVKIINTYESQDASWGVEPGKGAASGTAPSTVAAASPVAQAAQPAASGRTTLELQLALEAIRQQSSEQTQKVNDVFQQELLDTQKEAYESALLQAKEATGTNNRVLILAVLLLAGVCFIIFILVVINMVINLKSAKTQNEKFVETLQTVSQLVRVPSAPAALGILPPIYGADTEMRMIGSTVAETGLPQAPATDEEKAALNELARKCKDIGLQIDQVTGRKNNSKNVAEMIFKIAQEMGIGSYEATIFFAVGMAYDIGFLEIDAKLLAAETLTDDQKYEIRNHVKQGLAQLSFVPEKYMAVFADGVLMHHENMDGSGYPEGLSGNRIPYIARLIHVAESFVALISRRNYRDIYDKESAIAELRKKPGLYDQQIVDVLDRLI